MTPYERLLPQLQHSKELLYTKEREAYAAVAKLREAARLLEKKYAGIDLAPPRDRERISNWLWIAGTIEACVQASRHHVALLNERISHQHDLIIAQARSAELHQHASLNEAAEGVSLTPAEVEALETTPAL